MQALVFWCPFFGHNREGGPDRIQVDGGPCEVSQAKRSEALVDIRFDLSETYDIHRSPQYW